MESTYAGGSSICKSDSSSVLGPSSGRQQTSARLSASPPPSPPPIRLSLSGGIVCDAVTATSAVARLLSWFLTTRPSWWEVGVEVGWLPREWALQLRTIARAAAP